MTSGSDPRILTSGSDPRILTSGSDLGILTSGSDLGILTSGSDLGILTSGSDLGILTSGSDGECVHSLSLIKTINAGFKRQIICVIRNGRQQYIIMQEPICFRAKQM